MNVYVRLYSSLCGEARQSVFISAVQLSLSVVCPIINWYLGYQGITFWPSIVSYCYCACVASLCCYNSVLDNKGYFFNDYLLYTMLGCFATVIFYAIAGPLIAAEFPAKVTSYDRCLITISSTISVIWVMLGLYSATQVTQRGILRSHRFAEQLVRSRERQKEA